MLTGLLWVQICNVKLCLYLNLMHLQLEQEQSKLLLVILGKQQKLLAVVWQREQMLKIFIFLAKMIMVHILTTIILVKIFVQIKILASLNNLLCDRVIGQSKDKLLLMVQVWTMVNWHWVKTFVLLLCRGMVITLKMQLWSVRDLLKKMLLPQFIFMKKKQKRVNLNTDLKRLQPIFQAQKKRRLHILMKVVSCEQGLM